MQLLRLLGAITTLMVAPVRPATGQMVPSHNSSKPVVTADSKKDKRREAEIAAKLDELQRVP